MRQDVSRSPDLLRRFVATPYVFVDGVGLNRRSVLSNDLEMALAVRDCWGDQKHLKRPAVASWLLIREVLIVDQLTEINFLYSPKIRMLMVGTKTVISYDTQRSEILGFVSSATKTQHLVSELIPRLLES